MTQWINKKNRSKTTVATWALVARKHFKVLKAETSGIEDEPE